MRKYQIVVQYLCIIALVIPSVTMADGYRATVLEYFSSWYAWPTSSNELFETVNGLCGYTNSQYPIWFCGEENLLMKKRGARWFDYSGGDLGTCTDPLYDVVVNIPNPDNVISVGYNMLAITFDGGNTWLRQELEDPNPGVARSVVYDTFNSCFIYCRDNGEVRYGGTNPPYGSWSLIDGTAAHSLRGVDAVYDGANNYTNAVAVGESGSIYYAEDYTCESSELIEASILPVTSYSFNAVSFEWYGSSGVAVGDNGIIYYSEDCGRSWQEATTSAAGYDLNDVSISEGIVQVVGDEGIIMRSETSDIHKWIFQESGTDLDLFALSNKCDVALLAAGEKYAMHSIVPKLNGMLIGIVLHDDEPQDELQIVSVFGTGATQLRYTPCESGEIQILIYDVSGRVVHESRHFTEIGTELILKFDLSSSNAGDLPNGLYTCLLREGNTYFTDSFVIVK